MDLLAMITITVALIGMLGGAVAIGLMIGGCEREPLINFFTGVFGVCALITLVLCLGTMAGVVFHYWWMLFQ